MFRRSHFGKLCSKKSYETKIRSPRDRRQSLTKLVRLIEKLKLGKL